MNREIQIHKRRKGGLKDIKSWVEGRTGEVTGEVAEKRVDGKTTHSSWKGRERKS